jgi:hypothetical protein
MQNKNIIQCWVFYILFVGFALNVIASPSTNSQTSSNEWYNPLDTWLKENLDENSYKNISQIAQMLASQTKTEIQIESLEKQIRTDELLVQEKRKTLAESQQKIDLLKLTPNQIATIEKYNHSLDRDPHFAEWLTERVTWFDIGKDIILSMAFLILGILLESARQKRKRRRAT